MKERKIKKYGWKKQLPDPRDKRFEVTVPIKLSSVFLKDKYKMPPTTDQGNLGSCVSNAVAYALRFDIENKHVKAPTNDLALSRLFIYYNGRVIEGSVKSDSGLEIRDGIKTVAALGACTEKKWPYTISKFKNKPSASAFKEALNYKAVEYLAVDSTNVSAIVACLTQGYPVIIGFTVMKSFESDEVTNTGIVPMPKPNEQVLGGHCVVITGYDDNDKTFLCSNWWGLDWGMHGDFKMPVAYITNPNLADDFWIIKTIL